MRLDQRTDRCPSGKIDCSAYEPERTVLSFILTYGRLWSPTSINPRKPTSCVGRDIYVTRIIMIVIKISSDTCFWERKGESTAGRADHIQEQRPKQEDPRTPHTTSDPGTNNDSNAYRHKGFPKMPCCPPQRQRATQCRTNPRRPLGPPDNKNVIPKIHLLQRISMLGKTFLLNRLTWNS